jgi:hypothetical protein
MNDWREDLYSYVTNNVTLTAVISQRFHWQQLPDATYPATRFFAVSREINATHGGSAGHEVLTVQFDHLDTDPDSARSVALAFRGELNGSKVSANNFSGARLTFESDDFRDDAETYRITQEYQLHHAE